MIAQWAASLLLFRPGPTHVEGDRKKLHKLDYHSNYELKRAETSLTSPPLCTCKGQKDFQGSQLHSTEFSSGMLSKSREVLIVGGGNSAIDCASLMSMSRKDHQVTMLCKQASVPPSVLSCMIHVCMIHVCTIHVCMIHVCMIHVCMIHVCMIHVCMIHVCTIHVCMIHVCMIHVCMIHVCMIHVCTSVCPTTTPLVYTLPLVYITAAPCVPPYVLTTPTYVAPCWS